MAKWKRVSADDARNDPLYGFGGCLFAIYLIAVFTLLSLIAFSYYVPYASDGTDFGILAFEISFLWLPTLILLPLKYPMGAAKKEEKRLITDFSGTKKLMNIMNWTALDSAFLLLYATGFAMLYPIISTPISKWSSDLWVFWSFVLTALNYSFLLYAAKSRRFQVTYRHHIPDNLG